MPVEADTVMFAYVGDGVTTRFPFPARILSSADVQAYVAGTLVSAATELSANGVLGGTVVLLAPPAAGARVALVRKPPASQLTDFVNGQTVLEGVLDLSLDKLTMLVQWLARGLSLSVRAGEGSVGQLSPLPAERAGRLLGFGADGDVALVAPNPEGNGTVSADQIVDASAIGRAMLRAPTVNDELDILGLRGVSELLTDEVKSTEYYRRMTNAATQITLSTPDSYYVVDPAHSGYMHTVFAAGVTIHAEHLEEAAEYVFQCYYNSSYSAVIDFGPAAIISGADIGTRALELRGGESIVVRRAADNYFYVVASHTNDHTASDETTYEYRHTGANFYDMWRRVTVNAGVTASFGFASAYQAASVKRVLGCSLVGNAAGTLSTPHVTTVTDTSFSVHNPNATAVTVDIIIGNLKKANA